MSSQNPTPRPARLAQRVQETQALIQRRLMHPKATEKQRRKGERLTRVLQAVSRKEGAE